MFVDLLLEIPEIINFETESVDLSPSRYGGSRYNKNLGLLYTVIISLKSLFSTIHFFTSMNKSNLNTVILALLFTS